MQFSNKRYTWLAAGLLFAALWASASTATKLGLAVAQPLVIAVVRFGAAAAIMLFIAHLLQKRRLPAGREWKQIAIYGLLNITIYLGCYVIAMQTVTAGIGALATATNPVFISFLSVFYLKKPLKGSVIISIVVCSAGVICAAWPLFDGAAVTTNGLLILLFSMLSYSAAAIYFSSRQWNGLSLFVINGWQTLLGGVFLLPLPCFFIKRRPTSLIKHSGMLWAGWPYQFRSSPYNYGCGYCKPMPSGQASGYFYVLCLGSCSRHGG